MYSNTTSYKNADIIIYICMCIYIYIYIYTHSESAFVWSTDKDTRLFLHLSQT